MTTPTIDAIRHALPRRELRIFRGGVQYRAPGTASGASPKIAMRIPFESRSADLGFTEVIDRRAFDSTLRSKADVVALWNHESAWVLGRLSNRTLTITKGADALEGVVTLDRNNTMHMGTFAPCVQRGDVAGASFGFETLLDAWSNEADGTVVRRLLDVRLMDLSPVCWPAYPDSEAEVRALISGLVESRARHSLAHRVAALRLRTLAMRERDLARYDRPGHRAMIG